MSGAFTVIGAVLISKKSQATMNLNISHVLLGLRKSVCVTTPEGSNVNHVSVTKTYTSGVGFWQRFWAEASTRQVCSDPSESQIQRICWDGSKNLGFMLDDDPLDRYLIGAENSI